MVTPLDVVADAAVLIEDGVIQAAGSRAVVEVPAGTQSDDYGEALLAPGLVDIHLHGGAGVDVMSAGPGDWKRLRLHLARHGVTHFLATTVSSPWEDLLTSVGCIAQAGVEIHLEGPFLSPARRGVHPTANLLEPTRQRLEQLWQRSEGLVRMITVAPELPGAGEFIATAAAHDICVSLGHSDATAAQTHAGIAAGARHVTHTFNAMRPLHQREPGLLGVALSEAELSAEIIADGIHVDPALVKLFVHAKAPGKAILVTDAISAAGMGEGEFTLGGIAVSVVHGRCLAGETLAGSVLTLDQAVRNVVAWTGCGWAAAVRMASLNPALLLGWKKRGRLEAGAAADVAVFSPHGEILAAYGAGRLVN